MRTSMHQPQGELSGATHAAARAGVPSVVVPFAGDQFFWAERLRVRGIGLACPVEAVAGADQAALVAAACAPPQACRCPRGGWGVSCAGIHHYERTRT